MKRKLEFFLLLCITVIAFFLRFYKATEVPPSLNWDEVSIGYNAYSILKTGKDEWGKFLPLHFQSYGEYKLPVQIYFSIPAIAVFGLNDFGVRITPVIYGTLTILLLYFLVLDLFPNTFLKERRQLGLISSLFLAISPWHIQLTRASFESSFSVFWIMMGMWFFVKGFKKPNWWIVSIIPFVISIYTYNSARIFTPLFIFVVGFIFRQDFFRHRKQFFLALLTFIMLLLPLTPFVLSGKAATRYKLVSITNEAGLIPRINERRGASNLPQPLPRLIHNKATYISYYFVKNYLAHFTPSFLFVNGAEHRQHHVQKLGELYYFQAPLLLLGIYLLLKKKEKFRWLILAWLFLAFVPVAATKDSIPNALRTLIAVPTYQIFTAYGLVFLRGILKKKSHFLYCMLFSAILIVACFELGRYLYNYFYVYPIKYSRDWQYGNKKVLGYIKEHYAEYDKIVFSRFYGEPHMFTLFYLNYPPDKYQNDPSLIRFETNDWVWVLKFDKFYFPNLSDSWSSYQVVSKEEIGKKILFIGKSEDFPKNVQILKEINFLDGNQAFEIITN